MRSSTLLAGASCLALMAATTTEVSGTRDYSHVVKFHRRDPATTTYPAVLQTPPKSSLPKEWTDALEALQNAGKIPDIPIATMDQASGEPRYPGKLGLDDDKVCSWTVTNCFGKNDLHKAPDGDWIVSFDDGPTAVSSGLYDFLQQNNQAGTHFMIGSQIVAYKDAALHASKTNQQLAVHTWSHSLQSTKDNYGVLGELGWTMQIIYDLTGRVPNMWRPPQGDIDNRVRAIAEGVFNLTAVMWDAECNDWCIEADGHSSCPGEVPGQSQHSVTHAINKALAQPKSPGVMILEHELNKYTVGFFEKYFPTLKSRGWNAKNVPDSFGYPWYLNADNNDDTPVKVPSLVYSDIAAAMNASSKGPTVGNKAALKNNTGSNSSTTDQSDLTKQESNQKSSAAALLTGASLTLATGACALVAILL